MQSNSNHISSIEAITQLLFVEDPPQPADLVFVFGSNWMPTMDPAIELFKKKLVPKMLISGASYADTKRDKTECEVFCEYAISQGVDESALLREDQATNTLENMVLSYPIIEEAIGWSSIKKIIFVCKTFHARRVLMTAAKHWPAGIDYLCRPVIDERNIRRDNWWQEPIARQRVLEEVQRIATYTLKGDIGDL